MVRDYLTLRLQHLMAELTLHWSQQAASVVIL
jgi:hypothetical protein